MSTTNWVYQFSGKGSDGNEDMRDILGGKGANLAGMAAIGLPVPPGFTISTQVCAHYYANDRTYPGELNDEVKNALQAVEREVGMTFGDPDNPLLVSVRSGARVSMPGMMDTVLNLGLNDETVEGLARKSGDDRFAWDSYRRFMQMYGDVVLGLPHHDFEEILEAYKRDHDLLEDTDVTADGWRQVVEEYKDLVRTELGQEFPQDVHDQLWGAIGAVFGSWQTPRAITYRKIHNIPEEWGTAVNVQAMVFGNMGDDCATGVAFTRDPSTGENYFYGEFLVNAQGEDVVAGIRTPQSLTNYARAREGGDLPTMEDTMPDVMRQLEDVRRRLETHYRDMQDIEFTVQQGNLYMLQTRAGKRTAAAALKIAVDMVEENLISRERAVQRVEADKLDQLLHPSLDPNAHKTILGKGLPASPGAANGRLVFDANRAEEWASSGEDVILARSETSPEDIHGMHAAKAILTTRGGMTSHAAVVARGMGRPCVAGAGALQIEHERNVMHAGQTTLQEGDVVTIDGATGEVIEGRVPTLEPELSGDFATIMDWADQLRRMRVRANAETVEEARIAVNFGAQGIGLCRTEHMFFEPARIQRVREMIFAGDEDGRRAALNHLEPKQAGDFKALFAVMQGLPVTVRLLDPPLHEFLPQAEDDIQHFAEQAQMDVPRVQRRLAELAEANPMLGHRGCRLGVTYPEIYEMQVRALLEAALQVHQESGQAPLPEIMIPLAATGREVSLLRERVDTVAEAVFAEQGARIDYSVGTMIELPRACLRAGEIAQHADFFSFGTNDLTQTAMGISRDDSARFLPQYVDQGMFDRDPFMSLDTQGVGELIETAAQRGREVNTGLKQGICGEHGGDPDSIAFCEGVGLDYVSCSAYRVPIARLAAAQAAIGRGHQKKVNWDAQAEAEKTRNAA